MCIAGERIFYILCVLGPFGRVLVRRVRWLFFLGCVVLGVARYASRSPGLVFSLSVGRKRVDENVLCVAWLYGCVGVLGGMCLCWVVVDYLLVCGVVSFVFGGIMAECSTSDIGRDTCGSLVYYPLCCGCVLSSYWCTSHLTVTVFSTVGVLVLFFVHNLAQFQESAVCSRWLFAPYSLLCGVTVICEGHLESKECFAIKKYLLIIGNRKNM
jgi:hypothetical protein